MQAGPSTSTTWKYCGFVRYASIRVPLAFSKPAEQQGKLNIFKMSLAEGATGPLANSKRMMHHVHAWPPGPVLQSASVYKNSLLARCSNASIRALVCTMSISVRLPLVSQNEQESCYLDNSRVVRHCTRFSIAPLH